MKDTFKQEKKVKKINQIINEIFAMSICIILILVSILIGTIKFENSKIITYIATILVTIYIAAYKLVLKNEYKKILKSITVIDVCVAVICFSSFIPILSKTAVNYTDSYNICFRYLGVLAVYILSKILILEDNKYKNYFCIALIGTGIISAIIGIDNLTVQILTKGLHEMGITQFVNVEQRMFGGFGYANTFAMSLSIPLILCMDKYVNQEKKGIQYIVLSFIFITCIILTYSRATYVLLTIITILYCILQKNLKRNVKLINTCVVLLILGMVYANIFVKCNEINNYLILFGLLIIFIGMSVLFTVVTNKVINDKNAKKYIIFICISLVVFVLLIIVGLKLEKPLELFSEGTKNEEVVYHIVNMEPNKEYNLEFDIEAKTKDYYKVYGIEVIEKDNTNTQVAIHKIEFATFSGKKEIKFISKPNIDNISITFKAFSEIRRQGLQINELRINGEKHVLDYLYIPAKLVDRLQTLNLKNITKQGRIVFYKDAIKLIQRNPWTGIGGNGWEYKYREIMSYNYTTAHVHSYPLQIFLEFGIIAIIAYIIMLISIISNFKKIKKENYAIFIAMITILIHSIIDFDLSYFNMLLYTYILVGIISQDKEKI